MILPDIILQQNYKTLRHNLSQTYQTNLNKSKTNLKTVITFRKSCRYSKHNFNFIFLFKKTTEKKNTKTQKYSLTYFVVSCDINIQLTTLPHWTVITITVEKRHLILGFTDRQLSCVIAMQVEKELHAHRISYIGALKCCLILFMVIVFVFIIQQRKSIILVSWRAEKVMLVSMLC